MSNQTPAERWFLKHQRRAVEFRTAGIPGAVADNGGEFVVAMLMIIADGYRSLSAYVLEQNGVRVVLTKDRTGRDPLM